MSDMRRVACTVVMVTLMVASACTGDDKPARSATASTTPRPLPPPVQVRADPEGITLGDPAFVPLPGARADFGRLGGAVYQIEVPAHWNRRLVLYMHGYEELGPEAKVTAPDIRRYLIGKGYAWGASSFSSTSLIPGRAADETAALWDHFARKYGRPTRSYVTGLSMGGMATHIAAERYANRFDGALALCGSAGQTPAVMGNTDFVVAGAFVAGVTQAELDASTGLGGLIHDRILPALRDPVAHERFENIVLDLTGGPRAFDREGFRLEEDTNWRRGEILVGAGLAPNRDTTYRLGPLSTVTSDDFNRTVVRLPTNDQLLRTLLEGNETTGRLQMPLLSLHSTGDGQVPIEQARILQRRVDSAGKSDLLVQRVIRDASHCGFTSTETEAGLEALVAWTERGVKPAGTNVMVQDLRRLGRTFELSPRPGTPEADSVKGAGDRVVVRGRLTLDGAPFDAKWLGAVVRRAGLITPCQYTLPPVMNGAYEITVLADGEASGCGAPGADVMLWTFAGDKQLYSRETLRWPGNGRTTTFDATFSTSAPRGAVPATSDFAGEAFDRRGQQLPPGTRIEAYVGGTRCGVASVRRTGNYSGYSLAVVGPDSIAPCKRGATLTFRVNGRLVADTTVNEPSGHGSFDLTLR